MRVIPPSPTVSVLLVADGAPSAPRLLDALPRTVRVANVIPDLATLFTDWTVQHVDVVVIAVLLTHGSTRGWRSHPGYWDLMLRAVLVAPLPRDAGQAVSRACGAADFVAFDRLDEELGPAVARLARRLRTRARLQSRLQDDPPPAQRFE